MSRTLAKDVEDFAKKVQPRFVVRRQYLQMRLDLNKIGSVD